MSRKRQQNCSAPGCPQTIFIRRRFFKFPKEYDRWLQWVNASGRLDLLDKGPEYSYRNCRLCHLHFDKKWYKINDIRAYLHPDAIPTIFNRLGSNQQNITTVENEKKNAVVKQTVLFHRIDIKWNNLTGNDTTVENEKKNAVVKIIELGILNKDVNKDSNTCTQVITQVQEKNDDAESSKSSLQVAIKKIEATKPSTSTKRPTRIKKPLPDCPILRTLLLENQKLRAEQRALRAKLRRLRMKTDKGNITVKEDNECN